MGDSRPKTSFHGGLACLGSLSAASRMRRTRLHRSAMQIIVHTTRDICKEARVEKEEEEVAVVVAGRRPGCLAQCHLSQTCLILSQTRSVRRQLVARGSAQEAARS